MKKNKDDIKLKPHQLIPINFLKHNRSCILYHSTGSGKTITALKAMYQFDNDIIIIGSILVFKIAAEASSFKMQSDRGSRPDQFGCIIIKGNSSFVRNVPVVKRNKVLRKRNI